MAEYGTFSRVPGSRNSSGDRAESSRSAARRIQDDEEQSLEDGEHPTASTSNLLLGRPLSRRASRASSLRTGPLLVSHERPDELTRLIIDQYSLLPSSSALQETDLSVPPFGLDIPGEPPESFRRTILLSLDVLRGLLLALQADESIALFLRTDWEGDENWYSKQERWTESPLYALRLLANPAAPGFMILLGIGIVLFTQSRLQLGWSRWRLLRHFALRAGALVLLHALLELDFTVREDGPTLIENLLLQMLGINLLLLGAIVIGLHTFERYIATMYLSRSPQKLEGESAEPEEAAFDRVQHAEERAHNAGNIAVAALASGLLTLNMLAVPKRRTSPEARSDWFWFWIVPMPTELGMQYHKILSQYAPLNWLPFGLIGIIYARFLTRRARPPVALHAINLLLCIIFLTLFVLTRILKFGNLSFRLLPPHPHHPNNPYYESWQAFFYTVKFPPDLAYSSLNLGVIAGLFAVFSMMKTEWKEKLPLLQFGRAPIFFYAAQLLVFRFVANFALTFFGVPSRLDLFPALCCYFGTLVIVWFLCRGFLAFKDARSSPDSFWRFL